MRMAQKLMMIRASLKVIIMVAVTLYIAPSLALLKRPGLMAHFRFSHKLENREALYRGLWSNLSKLQAGILVLIMWIIFIVLRKIVISIIATIVLISPIDIHHSKAMWWSLASFSAWPSVQILILCIGIIHIVLIIFLIVMIIKVLITWIVIWSVVTADTEALYFLITS